MGHEQWFHWLWIKIDSVDLVCDDFIYHLSIKIYSSVINWHIVHIYQWHCCSTWLARKGNMGIWSFELNDWMEIKLVAWDTIRVGSNILQLGDFDFIPQNLRVIAIIFNWTLLLVINYGSHYQKLFSNSQMKAQLRSVCLSFLASGVGFIKWRFNCNEICFSSLCHFLLPPSSRWLFLLVL